MSNQIVLIDSPDAKGLVYNITKVIFDFGLNIISNHEYVDPNSKYFFMRTVLEGNHHEKKFNNKLRTVLPEEANIRLSSLRKKSIVILATKETHCLGDLLLRNSDGELPCDVKAVISNHKSLEGLTESFKIPYHHIPTEGCSRKEHEKNILACLEEYKPEYLVLAKYMRIFTRDFIKHYPYRIINIHHSFLPAFIGASPYKQAFERGVKIIGSTSHFVTDNLDEGPIIVQDVIPVNHTFTATGMAQAGRDVEKNVLAKSLKLVLENRVFIFKDKTIVFD